MEDRVTLNSGVFMPVIGFGTWSLTPDSIARSVVTLAIQAGYRLIDTASIYRNENGVGNAIKNSGIPRSEIFVTTKLWNTDQGFKNAQKAFDMSIDRLGLDYVDLYLIHWPSDKLHHEESWRALEGIYNSGRIKAIGVSNFTVGHLQELLDFAVITPAVNQVEFHPFNYDSQKSIIDFCHDQKIAIQAYSPLSQGRNIRDPRLSAISQKLGKSNAQVLIRWGIQHGVVPIPRSSEEKHIEQNIDVFDFEIPSIDMKKLDKLQNRN